MHAHACVHACVHVECMCVCVCACACMHVRVHMRGRSAECKCMFLDKKTYTFEAMTRDGTWRNLIVLPWVRRQRPGLSRVHTGGYGSFFIIPDQRRKKDSSGFNTAMQPLKRGAAGLKTPAACHRPLPTFRYYLACANISRTFFERWSKQKSWHAMGDIPVQGLRR
jgi:hypothetical protein